jgi:nucleotide-binding universal stress UspA family protein
MLKRILVGLGGTEYTPTAVRQAIELALAHDAQVTGVSVVDTQRLTSMGPVPLPPTQYGQAVRNVRMTMARELVEQAIEHFVEACTQSGVHYRVLKEEGEPFSLLISEARYHDLMVFGLRSLFEYDIVSDPHDALVRLVQAGVRPVIAVDRGYRPVKKVLIAYSGSMESAKAMKRFVQLRLWPDVQLRIVTFEHQVGEAKQLIGDAADYCRAHGLEPEVVFVPDAAKQHLLSAAAEWDADLLVVGNSAKNLLLRRVFGETALHVIRHTDRPLFLAQ